MPTPHRVEAFGGGNTASTDLSLTAHKLDAKKVHGLEQT
jgi:hypothetical protein